MLSTLLAKAVEGSIDPQELMVPIMLQALSHKAAAKSKTDEQGKSEVPPPDPKPTTEKKTKTAEATLFGECNFGGRKLDGMMRHAGTIVKQAKDPDNAWHWAREEAKTLESAMNLASKVADECQEMVQTSTLQALQKKLSGPDKATTFLNSHKEALVNASKIIAEPLLQIVGMHKVKIAVIDEAKKKKNASGNVRNGTATGAA
jgi:hypothetical protein